MGSACVWSYQRWPHNAECLFHGWWMPRCSGLATCAQLIIHKVNTGNHLTVQCDAKVFFVVYLFIYWLICLFCDMVHLCTRLVWNSQPSCLGLISADVLSGHHCNWLQQTRMKLGEIRLSVPLFVNSEITFGSTPECTAPCLSPPGNAGQVHLTLLRLLHWHTVADHDRVQMGSSECQQKPGVLLGQDFSLNSWSPKVQ